MSDKDEPMTKEEIAQEAFALADHTYDLLHLFPEDEKWETELRMRKAANDLMFYTAEAAGNIDEAPMVYDWGNASKHAYTLKTLYRFAVKQKLLDLDPDIIVRLDRLIKNVRREAEVAVRKTKELDDASLNNWRERYKIWKETEL